MITFSVHDGQLYFIAETEQGPVAQYVKLLDNDFTLRIDTSASASGSRLFLEGVVECIACVSLEEFYNKTGLPGKDER